MTAAICSCLSDAGPWKAHDEPGIPPSYTQTLQDSCAVHGTRRPKYRTLVVDPPWAYRQTLAKNGAESHYGVMAQEDIKALPVADWAEANAHLYVWTTNAFMVQAHELVVAWGFDQKTILTWIKKPISLGFYYRNNTEHCLFAVRGSLRCSRVDVGTAFEAPRGRHSEKPAAFYDMVESMSPGPYLDVFNRKQRLGWDAWGAEAYTPSGLPEPVRAK